MPAATSSSIASSRSDEWTTYALAASISSTTSHAIRASGLALPYFSEASVAALTASDVSFVMERQEDGLKATLLDGAKAPAVPQAVPPNSNREEAKDSFMVE